MSTLKDPASPTVHAETVGDRPAIERIYREAVGAADWLPGSARLHPDFGAVSQGEVVYVAKDVAGEVVGFISVYVPESFIHHLFIAPHAQRQGVGSVLLASLGDWLPSPWRLKCVRANRRALAFYAARGWQGVGSGESPDGEYVLLELRPAPEAAS